MANTDRGFWIKSISSLKLNTISINSEDYSVEYVSNVSTYSPFDSGPFVTYHSGILNFLLVTKVDSTNKLYIDETSSMILEFNSSTAGNTEFSLNVTGNDIQLTQDSSTMSIVPNATCDFIYKDSTTELIGSNCTIKLTYSVDNSEFLISNFKANLYTTYHEDNVSISSSTT